MGAFIGGAGLRLGHWLGASAQSWLNLPSAYDIRVARSRALADPGYSRGKAQGRESCRGSFLATFS